MVFFGLSCPCLQEGNVTDDCQNIIRKLALSIVSDITDIIILFLGFVNLSKNKFSSNMRNFSTERVITQTCICTCSDSPLKIVFFYRAEEVYIYNTLKGFQQEYEFIIIFCLFKHVLTPLLSCSLILNA